MKRLPKICDMTKTAFLKDWFGEGGTGKSSGKIQWKIPMTR